MVAALAVALLASQEAPRATRFDAFERIKQFDVAWMATADKARRRLALPHSSAASAAWAAGRYAEACRSLDLATATLEGRMPLPEDAATVRFESPIIEPGQSAALIVSWAYNLSPGRSVPVRTLGEEVVLEPGQTKRLFLDVTRASQDLTPDSEAGVLVPVAIGSVRRGAYVSIVKSPAARIEALGRSGVKLAAQIGRWLGSVLASGPEHDSPLIDPLFFAEEISSGELSLAEAETVWHAAVGNTVLRASLPSTLSEPTTLVVAIHGTGGNEHSFPESLGRGSSQSAAYRRGWAFISVRRGSGEVQDAAAWFKEARGVNPSRLFVIAHESGASEAMLAASRHQVHGIALFGPAVDRDVVVPSVPVFVGVGLADSRLVLDSSRRLSGAGQGRRADRYLEVADADSLTIVPECVEDAYRFLERLP